MNRNRPQTLFSYIFNILSNYKTQVTVFIVIGLIWAITNTLMPYGLKLIIDKAVTSDGHSADFLKTIQPYILFYLLVWIILCLDMRLLDWIKLKLFPSIRQDIMSGNFAYLNQHSYHYFQNNFSGELINKIVDLQGGVVDILAIIDECLAQTLGLIIAILTLLIIHPIFALLLFTWVTAFLLITFYFLKPITQLSLLFAEARSTLVGKMVDSITNIINVHLFAKNQHENKYINKTITNTIQQDRNMLSKIIKMRLLLDCSLVVFLGCNLILLVKMYDHHQVTVGDFSFIISLSMGIFFNLFFLTGQFVNFSEQAGKCKQALSILNTPHDIIDYPHSQSLIITQGKIEFKNVTFHYKNGTKLFNNKNIQIHPTEKVGLVGFSGSGKSTFVNLILRLFEVESGEITIDDQNINQVTQNSLRKNIALIPQDISLFHRSLMDNLRYGNSEATDEEVIEASKKAHCHEFISQLQDGYQTMVGERGIKLSGGQRQRIAIARAMLKKAPILILDEATSALDSLTEKYIQDALYYLMQGKTTIVIAHRLSTLAKMDRILVFNNGAIIEDGTHAELIKLKGHYAHLWHMQAGGFLPE